jgi:soluble lytic murein transglycosylase-like protein
MTIPFRRILAPRVPKIAAALLPVTMFLGMFDIPLREQSMSIILQAPKPPKLTYNDLIAPTARRVGVDVALVKSIVKAESAFNPDAVSPKGALGLMQVMPQTALEMGLDASEPAQNLEAGTRYLKWLLARYSKKKNSLSNAIAAYNAGPGAVDKHRGIPRFKETRSYVARVLRYLKEFNAAS